jgi:hypothetical protein
MKHRHMDKLCALSYNNFIHSRVAHDSGNCVEDMKEMRIQIRIFGCE